MRSSSPYGLRFIAGLIDQREEDGVVLIDKSEDDVFVLMMRMNVVRRRRQGG